MISVILTCVIALVLPAFGGAPDCWDQDDGTPPPTPEEQEEQEEAVQDPVVEGLQVTLVAGRDRYLRPEVTPSKLRVGLLLEFGLEAPSFHPDMLGAKALKWVSAEGQELPLASEPPGAGTIDMPQGTIFRTFHKLAPPEFGTDRPFKLTWSYPGIDPVALDFVLPVPVAMEDMPDFNTATLEEIQRSQIRFHVSVIRGTPEDRESLGSITYQLLPEERSLPLARSLLTKSCKDGAYDDLPVYHIQPDLFCRVGPVPDPAVIRSPGFDFTPIPAPATEQRFARGDLVLVASLRSGMQVPDRTSWSGRLMWIFAPMIAVNYEDTPYSWKLGELFGDDSLLTQLAGEKTVLDGDRGIALPIRLIVIDRVEYLSYPAESL